MEMASYILSVLRTDLMVVFSWGFHSPKAIEDGLRFSVNGFLHRGLVEVVYQEGEDLFLVRIINADGTVKEEVDGIYVDGLIDYIDRKVERTPEFYTSK